MKRKGVLVVIFLAVVFRIFLINTARHGDINNNTSWGQLLLERGVVNFYEREKWPYSAPNQPPLYLLTFGVTSFLQQETGLFIHSANNAFSSFPSKLVWWFDTWGELYYAKLPAIVADIGIGLVIYRLAKGKKGLLFAAIWFANPIVWYNSSVWGGTDSIVNFFGILSLYFLINKKLTLSSLFFLFSVLFKGSLLIFVPLWLLMAFNQKFLNKEWMKASLYSLLVFFVLTIPFHPQIDLPLWFLNLYTNRFLPGEIGSLTANAFNFWWIVDSGKTLDSTFYLGMTARMWGMIITSFIYLVVVVKAWKSKNLNKSFMAFATVSFAYFMFMTRIHERYLYPFFPLATIALSYIKWLWVPYLILSTIHLLNLYNLFWALGTPTLQGFYLNPLFAIGLSFINLLVFLYLFFRFIRDSHSLT